MMRRLWLAIIVLGLGCTNGGGEDGGLGSADDGDGTADSGATDWTTGISGDDDGTGGPDGDGGDADTGDDGGPGVEVDCDEYESEIMAKAPADCGSLGCLSWCDSAAWPGGVPGPQSDVVIPAGSGVLVDCDAEVGMLTVDDGAALVASREQSSTLTLHGNLVVHGRVDYGTSSDRIPDGVAAEIVIAAPSDDSYVGTQGAGPDGFTPAPVVDSDVGIWIVEGGVFTAAGAIKRAWSRLVDGAGPGDASFAVQSAQGWSPGDTIVLTPSAESSVDDHYAQFDEGQVASVSGDDVNLATAPEFDHAGCDDGCWRRAEAANLTRNVVIRSQNDENHGHVFVADQGVIQLDSAELRWLGPSQDCTSAQEPARRSALFFHQQLWDSDESFVLHASIWGGDRGFIRQEMSHGVDICDVVGYDGQGSGFRLYYDNGAGAFNRDDSSQGTVYRHVLAAKLRVPTRSEGCIRIAHRMAGIVPDGAEGTGAIDCVVTGVGQEGSGADISGIMLSEGGSGRPADFLFNANASHNNNGHGMFIWHNAAKVQPHYEDIAFWSNENLGLRFGAYGNPYVFERLTALDNGRVSVGIKIVPGGERSPLQGADLDSLAIESYVLVQQEASVLVDLNFSGVEPVAFTQDHTGCNSPGEEMDPGSSQCNLIWLRIVNPVFDPGVTQPFDFGWTQNFHSRWEVEGFSHANYANLPSDFTLHRSDNEVAGGCYFADFDAWMVPCP